MKSKRVTREEGSLRLIKAYESLPAHKREALVVIAEKTADLSNTIDRVLKGKEKIA